MNLNKAEALETNVGIRSARFPFAASLIMTLFFLRQQRGAENAHLNSIKHGAKAQDGLTSYNAGSARQSYSRERGSLH